MKRLSIQRHIFPVLVLAAMNLALPLAIGAAADDLTHERKTARLSDSNRISHAEIRASRGILAEQSFQLTAQQQFIDNQQKEIARQYTLRQSVQTQLNRLVEFQTTASGQQGW